MILWSMQPATALADIKKNGVYRCDESRSYNLRKSNSLKPQYRWLMERMEDRIGPPPAGVSYPIWAWHTWKFRRQPPEPDSPAFMKRRSDRVFFTLDVPEDAAVLTDFDTWQAVLAGGYAVPAMRPEALAAEADRLALLAETDPAAYEQAVRDSWENVFRLDRMDTDELTRGKFIQATLWELRRKYILDALIVPADFIRQTPNA